MNVMRVYGSKRQKVKRQDIAGTKAQIIKVGKKWNSLARKLNILETKLSKIRDDGQVTKIQRDLQQAIQYVEQSFQVLSYAEKRAQNSANALIKNKRP